MISTLGPSSLPDCWLSAHLLGTVDFIECLAVQQRLVQQARDNAHQQITLLVCEHRAAISVGRAGSRAHLHLSPEELTSHSLEIHWLNRGGGCMLHLPGQLNIYAIVPLGPRGWSVGQYLGRLHRGLLAALAESNIHGGQKPARHGIWGRTGQLAAIGVAVKHEIAYFGASLNVCPGLHLYRKITTDGQNGTQMSSLVVESQKPVKMAGVRAAVVRQLAAALDCDRFHLHTGHPLLAPARPARGKPDRR